MSEHVYDTCVLVHVNVSVPPSADKELFERRLGVVKKYANGQVSLRIGRKLLDQYMSHVKHKNNIVIETFFSRLGSNQNTILVKKEALSRQDYQSARKCNWPAHDDPLLSVAVGGANVQLVVAENRHVKCSAKLKRIFGIKTVDLSA